MISYTVYKMIHIFGILLLFTALGGVTLHVLNGGTKEFSNRKIVAITHGIGLFLILLGGFGMLARLGVIWSWPGWVIAKFAIWLAYGGLLTVVYKKPSLGKMFWFGFPLLGLLVVYVAIYKPF
ncbi:MULTISPECIES: hypothetical protein [Leptospira]|uniref:Invasion protein expression up-regulator SirB n=7 Tax=Leptospira TaxID=171 RepID=M3H0A7_9LEPT|nr:MULTISPECIES: hypothetical protein [Leptospira]EMF82160.1 hypothetical protein LEP1GSC188_3301 [Leptospira weilii serovar Topaz str. LT2116]EMM72523.1 hypothetical protein LEP1GSC038_0570 [Leptospira weilii str. 2006001855]EMY15500.1 hypothetical protein LEP1GSC043_4673 [Leptospira weilii str. Ecochallenge]AXR62640.1 hypothetical protein DQM68_18300 [Leptospira mayottensis]AXR66465.1 hypothetical protein DQM28_19915 [Leptospira mayottensis]